MGVVNVTPDSFSDGGRYLDPRAAVEHGRRLAAEGAQMLDVGGESTRPGGAEGRRLSAAAGGSTRPGAAEVPAEEELRRVLPVVEGLAGAGATISIDTSKAPGAEGAPDGGAGY